MEFLRGPQKAEPITRNREGRATGPNPFLDEGWLEQSYQSGDTMSVVVAGYWEERQKTNKQREPQFDAETGEPIMQTVLAGDAATAVALIRRAADYLGIGVSVDTVPATNERGRELKNQVEVKYRAKERKAPRKTEDE